MSDPSAQQQADGYRNIPDWLQGTSTPRPDSRSASSWRADGAFGCPAAQWIQVLGPRPGRVTIVIQNVGANDVGFQVSNNEQATPFPTTPGSVFTLDSEGELWAFSELGTTIALIETYWPISAGSFRPGGKIPYIGNILP